MRLTPDRPLRDRIDMADETAARAWVKKLGRPAEEIAAAIRKVGDSAAAVKKELGCTDPDAP